jgi:hypothetical protein
MFRAAVWCSQETAAEKRRRRDPRSRQFVGKSAIFSLRLDRILSRWVESARVSTSAEIHWQDLLCSPKTGLLSATVSSEIFKAAQPALLYLVPFTLLPLLLMAYVKGDLRRMWTGFHPDGLLTATVNPVKLIDVWWQHGDGLSKGHGRDLYCRPWPLRRRHHSSCPLFPCCHLLFFKWKSRCMNCWMRNFLFVGRNPENLFFLLSSLVATAMQFFFSFFNCGDRKCVYDFGNGRFSAPVWKWEQYTTAGR